MIKRQLYLNQLNQYKDKPFIKVITGMRRVGKSVLLNLFIENLIQSGVSKDMIFNMNFELPESFHITNFKELTEKVLSFSEKKTGKLYLLLDEVGRVEQWEKAVNAFHSMGNFDIYITGSNADLLSSDLSTYLAGRYVEILVHPLSFKEFKLLNLNSTFEDYIIFGGIPSIAPFNLNYELSMTALRDSFKSAFVKDVILRNSIRNTNILDKLINYILANTGKTFSALSISNYFKSQKLSVSVDTILTYLNIIEDAFLIYRVKRSDLIGKSILKTEEKYYIADHGIREAMVGYNNQVIEMILENIVYLELVRKGYLVYVGKVGELEIDFVCVHKDHSKSYYQVSYLLKSNETLHREFKSLNEINDQYPKYVLTMDTVDFSRDGIKHLNIVEFLSQD